MSFWSKREFPLSVYDLLGPEVTGASCLRPAPNSGILYTFTPFQEGALLANGRIVQKEFSTPSRDFFQGQLNVE